MHRVVSKDYNIVLYIYHILLHNDVGNLCSTRPKYLHLVDKILKI